MLFDILFDLKLSPDEAAGMAQKLVENQRLLEQQLGRSVDIRVAALDYFVSSDTPVFNPKITDLGAYEGQVLLASTDALTGLYNRRFLADTLQREIHRSRRHGIPFALLFLDIDDFKKINDGYGHQIGDAVLRNFASYLRGFLRSEDIVGRYGGEEFLVVMPQTDIEGARILGERLLDRLATRTLHPEVTVTFSGGISTFPNHAETVERLVESADRALYSAKMNGKRQIRVASPEKRRDRRYPGNALQHLELECCKISGNRDRGLIRNLSRSGISFEWRESLSIGDTVQLSVHSRSNQREYDIIGRVVWTTTVPDPVRYQVGAQYSKPIFRELDDLVSLSAM
jgi:diguanylate cyclase (GGDEF)-like protein